MGALINYEDNKTLQVIKESVAKDATPAEFNYFLEFCKSTGLNPFKKEIWFIKTNSGVQIITGINGFLTIANNHPQFDGMEVSLQEENGKLISATAKVYRKDRRIPSCATVYLNEYFKPSKFGNGMWEKMPRMMLQKVAKSVALREAFSQELSGIYIEEEMPPQEQEIVTAEPVKTYIYKISAIPDEEKKNALLKSLHERNIETTISNGEEYFESEQKLDKLSDYEVKKIGD
jgi:phage recombination protein Bet